jgi:hypothetical protein
MPRERNLGLRVYRAGGVIAVSISKRAAALLAADQIYFAIGG